MAEQKVKVYGADWCPTTVKVRKHLERFRIPYEYIDVEKDATASQWVKDQNGGKEKKPTLDIGGKILTEPSTDELADALRASALL